MSDPHTVIIYHNPRCSKSRQTLALLQQQGITPKVIEYLQQPPSFAELDTILQQLNLNPRQLMRSKEQAYKESHLADPNLDRTSLIEAMLANPILIERPIVCANGKAALGRPPEAVLDIL